MGSVRCPARGTGRGACGDGLKVVVRPGAGGLEALTAACSVEAGDLPVRDPCAVESPAPSQVHPTPKRGGGLPVLPLMPPEVPPAVAKSKPASRRGARSRHSAGMSPMAFLMSDARSWPRSLHSVDFQLFPWQE